MTKKEERILSILKEGPQPVAGSDLAKLAKMSSMFLYPILMRLEKDGVISSVWEDMEKPRRRLYSLTELGRLS